MLLLLFNAQGTASVNINADRTDEGDTISAGLISTHYILVSADIAEQDDTVSADFFYVEPSPELGGSDSDNPMEHAYYAHWEALKLGINAYYGIKN